MPSDAKLRVSDVQVTQVFKTLSVDLLKNVYFYRFTALKKAQFFTFLTILSIIVSYKR